MTGIFVDRWREGTKSKKEILELISFCNAANIEDIYLHCHEDIAVQDDQLDKHDGKKYDYFDFTLKNKGDIKVHLWISTTRGRDKPNQHTKKVLLKNLEYTSIQRLHGTVLGLDLTGTNSKVWFLNRVKKFMRAHPDIYGIHLDRFLPTYGPVVAEIKAAYSDKYITLAEYNTKLPLSWNVNEIITMRTTAYSNISKETFEGYKTVGLSLFACDLKKTKERLTYLKGLGKSPILFNYGEFSNNVRETRKELIEVINGSNK